MQNRGIESDLASAALESEAHLRRLASPRAHAMAMATQQDNFTRSNGHMNGGALPAPAVAPAGSPHAAEDVPFDSTPLDASLSSQYLQRRLNRSQGIMGAGMASPRPAIAGFAMDRPYAPAGGVPTDYNGGIGSNVVAGHDLDYKFESLQLMLTSFKTKMRQDFDATFSSIERKSRTQRKEILAHMTASLEDSEARLSASLKSHLGDYQLLEIEFRKNLKMDLYTLRNEMEAAIRNEEEMRADMTRRMKMQESHATELRQKLEELLITGGGGRGGGLNSPAGNMHFDQQLLAFQHSLEALQTKFALDVMSHRKEAEMKNVELSHQILDLRKVVETQLTNEEANQRAQVDMIRANGEATAKEIQTRVDESLSNMNALLKNLYRNLDLTTQNQDVLHAQLSDLQARESGQGGAPGMRKVTKAELDGVEEKLMSIVHGPTGAAASATTIRELQNSLELQSRKLDQLAGQSRETLDESDLRGRMALEKFKQEFTLATEGRIGTIILDQEIIKRKVDLLQPDLLQHDLTTKVGLVEKDLQGRLAMAREEAERGQRATQVEHQATRDRTQQLERRVDDLAALVQTLVGQVKDLTGQATKARDDTAAREKKHMQDLFDLREKHTKELHDLRKELSDDASQREAVLRDELSRASAKVLAVTDEKHGALSAKLEIAESTKAGARAEVERTMADELQSQVRRIDGEFKKVRGEVAEIDLKARKTEEVMKIAEELAKQSTNKDAAVSTAELQSLQTQIAPLQLQVKLLTDKQEHILRTVSDAVIAQSATATSVASTHREMERLLAASRQDQLETLKQSQNQLTTVRGDLESSLSAVELRLTKDANESRLKIQDIEHGLKLAKKYRSDEMISPRSMDGASSSLVEVASGHALAKESTLRSLQLQVEEFEFKLRSLAQSGSSLKAIQDDLAPRVDSLEREVADVRKRALQRDAAVDEAMRNRIDTLTFDKFKREFNAHSQSQQAATLAAAQTALATAQQAKHAVTQQQSIAAPSSPSWSAAPMVAPFTLPEPVARPLSPIAPIVRPVGRSSSSGSISPRARTSTSVSPKSALRTGSGSTINNAPTPAAAMKSVHFAEDDDRPRQSSTPTNVSTLPLASVLPILEKGHSVLKCFVHGPPIPKQLFYSQTPLPDANTGVIPNVSTDDATCGFIHWVELDDSTRRVLPMSTLPVSRVILLAAGKHTRAFQKADSSQIPSELCLSIMTPDRSLELQAETREIRDLWLRGVYLLLKQQRIKFEFQGDRNDVGPNRGDDTDEEDDDDKEEQPDSEQKHSYDSEEEEDEAEEDQPDEDDDEQGHPANTDEIDESLYSDDGADNVDGDANPGGASSAPAVTAAPSSFDDDDDYSDLFASDSPAKSSAPAAEAMAVAAPAEVSPSLLAAELARAESARAFQAEMDLERQRQAAQLEAEREAHAAARRKRQEEADAEIARVKAQREADEAAAHEARMKKQAEEAAAAAKAAADKAEADRQAAAEAARLESERLAAEEADRAREAARRAAEAARLQEEARLAEAKRVAEEAAKAEADRKHAELLAQKQREIELERARMEAEAAAKEAQRKAEAEAAAAEEQRIAALKVEEAAKAAAAKAAKEKAEAEQREIDAARKRELEEARRRVEEQRLKDEEAARQIQAAEAEARAQAEAAAARAAALKEAELNESHQEVSTTHSASHDFDDESEEDEIDEEDEDDRPEWLHPEDELIQLTLRAERVHRLGNVASTELVYHISESGVPSGGKFFVLDRHHLHGLDEDEIEEYTLEHPDCVNSIFDIRFPMRIDPSVHKKIRVRIYDVLKSSPTARMDNLVGEVNDVDLHQLMADAPEGRQFTPTHPNKPNINDTLKAKGTTVMLQARLRRNLRERQAAGLPPKQIQISKPPPSAAPAAPAAAAAPVATSPAVAVAAPKKTFQPSFTVECRTASQFGSLRSELRSYGVSAFQHDMKDAGWFVQEGGNLVLSTGDKPFNPFARLVSGKLPAPYGNLLLRYGLVDGDREFFVAQNRPELDAEWNNSDPAWVGKASMSKRHQFLLIKSLHWSTFNVSTMGIDGTAQSLTDALHLLDRMASTAREYTHLSGWSDDVGLYFHAYPFNSVHALHLHMVDLETRGPTFQYLNHKNLSIEEVRKQLWSELYAIDTNAAKKIENPSDNTKKTITPPTAAAATPIKNTKKQADYHEKGESDDDLDLGFSPSAARPAQSVAGSMMAGGDDDDSSDPDESMDSVPDSHSTPARSAPPPAAAAPGSASSSGYVDDWDALEAPITNTTPTATNTRNAIEEEGEEDDDDDDVSDDSDDGSHPSHVASSLGSYSLKPGLSGASSRGGLASTIIGKKPTTLGKLTSAGTPIGGTQAAARSKSNFKIGMKFGDEFDDDEEEEEEGEHDLDASHDGPGSMPPSRQSSLPPLAGRRTAAAAPNATQSVIREEDEFASDLDRSQSHNASIDGDIFAAHDTAHGDVRPSKPIAAVNSNSSWDADIDSMDLSVADDEFTGDYN